MITRIDPGVASLQPLVQGPVLSAEDAAFAGELAAFNAATEHRPAIAVGATSTADVQEAVRWAAARGLTVGVHATGHGAAAAYRSGLVVSTRRLTDLAIDPDRRTARIGAGVRWRAVVDAAAAHGLAPLNGSSSSVGAVGYTVGGGLPVLGRTFGWASDLARSFELVMADGRVVTVAADRETDLFAALRGGKPDVGIVTAMTVELVPVQSIYGGAIYFDGSDASRLLHAYRDWCADLPDTWTTALKLLRLPPLPEVPAPLRGRFTVQLAVAFVGAPAAGERALRPMRAAGRPLIDAVGPMAYRDVDSIHHDPDHPVPVRETVALLPDLDDDAIDRIEAIAGLDSACPFLMVELRQLGGALARQPAIADSVGARDAAYTLFFLGALLGPVAEAIPEALDRAVSAMAPVSSGRTFVNMHGTPTTAEDRARAWPADIVARLQRLKTERDPERRFRFVHTLTADPEADASRIEGKRR